MTKKRLYDEVLINKLMELITRGDILRIKQKLNQSTYQSLVNPEETLHLLMDYASQQARVDIANYISELSSSSQQQQSPSLQDKVEAAIVKANVSELKALLPDETVFLKLDSHTPILDVDQLLALASRITKSEIGNYLRQLKAVSELLNEQMNPGTGPRRAKRSRTPTSFFNADASASSSASAAAIAGSRETPKSRMKKVVSRPEPMAVSFDFGKKPQNPVSSFAQLANKIDQLDDLFEGKKWKEVIGQGMHILQLLMVFPDIERDINQHRYLTAMATALISSAIITQRYSEDVKFDLDIELGGIHLKDLGLDLKSLADFNMETARPEKVFKQGYSLQIALVFALISNNLSKNLPLVGSDGNLYKPFANLVSAADNRFFNLSSIIAYMDSEIAQFIEQDNLKGWQEMARIYTTLTDYHLDMRNAAMLVNDKGSSNASYAESLQTLLNVLDYTVKIAEACQDDVALKEKGIEYLTQAYASINSFKRFKQTPDDVIPLSNDTLLAYFDRAHASLSHYSTQISDEITKLSQLDQHLLQYFRPQAQVSPVTLFAPLRQVSDEDREAADTLLQFSESPVVLKS